MERAPGEVERGGFFTSSLSVERDPFFLRIYSIFSNPVWIYMTVLRNYDDILSYIRAKRDPLGAAVLAFCYDPLVSLTRSAIADHYISNLKYSISTWVRMSVISSL